MSIVVCQLISFFASLMFAQHINFCHHWWWTVTLLEQHANVSYAQLLKIYEYTYIQQCRYVEGNILITKEKEAQAVFKNECIKSNIHKLAKEKIFSWSVNLNRCKYYNHA